MHLTSRQTLAALIPILLAGALLRFHHLSDFSTMLHHDEAWNGWRAATWLNQPEFVFYFPDNTGNESGWTYLLAGSIKLFGTTPFALRIVAMFTGVLTLAAVYTLAKQLFNRDTALRACAGLAVLYWHAHINHVAFHGNLYPLIAALALTATLKAFNSENSRAWLIAGIFTGLLAYTYTAAHGWTLFLLALMGLHLLQHRQKWRVILPAISVILLLIIPVYLSILNTPAQDGGLSRTLIADTDALRENLTKWLNAWLINGDNNHVHNFPDRPVLDIPLAILTATGILTLLWRAIRTNLRKNIRPLLHIILLAALLLISLLPSLLTIEAPHFLRGIGATLILALLIGTGAYTLARLPFKYVALLPVGLLLWAGFNSYQTFDMWLQDDYQLQLSYEDRVYNGMQFIAENTPDDMPIYIPGLSFHPVAAYLAAGKPERDPVFYDYPDYGTSCFIIPREETVFLDLPIVLPHFEDRIFSENVSVLYEAPDNDYNIYRVQPDDNLVVDWDNAALSGDFLQYKALDPVPQPASPGDVITVHLGMRVMNPIPTNYQMFVHLYGDPTPYDGGTMWATGDAELCPMVFVPQRTHHENLIQTIQFMIPEDVPGGEYTLAMGLYELANPDARPNLQTPSGETRYYPALTLIIED